MDSKGTKEGLRPLEKYKRIRRCVFLLLYKSEKTLESTSKKLQR